jgi:hypothetical protein
LFYKQRFGSLLRSLEEVLRGGLAQKQRASALQLVLVQLLGIYLFFGRSSMPHSLW